MGIAEMFQAEQFILALVFYFISAYVLRSRISLMLIALTDIYIASVLIFSLELPLKEFFVWFHIIKGIASIGGSVMMGHYLDWMGWVDLLTGMSLVTTQFGVLLVVLPIIAFFFVVSYIAKLPRVTLLGVVFAAVIALASLRFFVVLHGILLIFKGFYSMVSSF